MSAFGQETTTDEVLQDIDLSGRRVVITGGASGLGRESARAMASRGASVTVLARNASRAGAAAAEIESMVPGASVESGIVDLADLSTIRTFANDYLTSHDAIDVLINNAGVMACPFGHTADGFETQFGTNHLGHFLLTALLSPAIMRGSSPRVVTLSSAGHSRSDIDLTDPNFENTEYSAWDAYGRSKSANALFAYELARRGGPKGLLSFSVHPGMIVTELGRHLTEDLINEMAAFARDRSGDKSESGDAQPDDALQDHDLSENAKSATSGMSFKSVEAGAATQVWAATAPELSNHNGAYLANCGLGVLGADPGVNGFRDYITDDATAEGLWDLSEEMVGEHFTL